MNSSEILLGHSTAKGCGELRFDFCSGSHMERSGFGKERFVELCEGLQDSQFQENAANEVVEIENAEECFFAGGLTIVYAQVAHLADVVRRHHHPVVRDELDEGCSRHQFIQACSLRQLDILKLIESLHQPLQCPAAVEGRNIVLATALRLGSLAVYAEVPKRLYFSQVVKITHRANN